MDFLTRTLSEYRPMTKNKAQILVGAILGLFLGFGCLGGFVYHIRESYELSSHGIETSGVVVRSFSRTSHGGQFRERISHICEIEYAGHRKEFHTSSSGPSPGSLVPVIYVPEHPDMAKIKGADGLYMNVGVGLLLLLGGLVFTPAGFAAILRPAWWESLDKAEAAGDAGNT